jgi:phage terminase large subunit-like protein
VVFTTDGCVGEHSPDRADAAIWALIELMLSPADAAGGWSMRGSG